MRLRAQEASMQPTETREIRVRPVVRHIVTEYHSGVTAEGSNYGGCATLGEFDSEAQAEKVAAAIRAQHEPREYVMVEQAPGKEFPRVFYAYSEQEVADFLSKPRLDSGYNVFSRARPRPY
jgi:hypothetical protein